MRLITGFGVAALAMVLGGTAKPAAAQQVPPGSYRQTCRNIGVQGDTLYADCMDTNRNWQSTQLRDYDDCIGEIQNLNGSLQCTGNGYGRGVYNGPYNGPYNNGGYYGRDRDRDYDHDGDDDRDRDRVNHGYGRGNYGYDDIPYGSYSQTCQNIRVYGNDLQASCQKRNGRWRNTTLRNFEGCRDIENDNGKLRCR